MKNKKIILILALFFLFLTGFSCSQGEARRIKNLPDFSEEFGYEQNLGHIGAPDLYYILDSKGLDCLTAARNILALSKTTGIKPSDIYQSLNLDNLKYFLWLSDNILTEENFGIVIRHFRNNELIGEDKNHAYANFMGYIQETEEYYLSAKQKVAFLNAIIRRGAIDSALTYLRLLQIPQEERERVAGAENSIEEDQWRKLSSMVGEHTARCIITDIKSLTSVDIKYAIDLVNILAETAERISEFERRDVDTFPFWDLSKGTPESFRYLADIVSELAYQDRENGIKFVQSINAVQRIFNIFARIAFTSDIKFAAGEKTILPCLRKFRDKPKQLISALSILGITCSNVSDKHGDATYPFNKAVYDFCLYMVPSAVRQSSSRNDLEEKLKAAEELFEVFMSNGAYTLAEYFQETEEHDDIGKVLFNKKGKALEEYEDAVFELVGRLGKLKHTIQSTLSNLDREKDILTLKERTFAKAIASLISAFPEVGLFKAATEAVLAAFDRITGVKAQSFNIQGENVAQDGEIFIPSTLTRNRLIKEANSYYDFYEFLISPLANLCAKENNTGSFATNLAEIITRINSLYELGMNINSIVTDLGEIMTQKGSEGLLCAFKLVDEGIYPSMAIVNAILDGEITLDECKTRMERIKIREINIFETDEISLSLAYTIFSKEYPEFRLGSSHKEFTEAVNEIVSEDEASAVRRNLDLEKYRRNREFSLQYENGKYNINEAYGEDFYSTSSNKIFQALPTRIFLLHFAPYLFEGWNPETKDKLAASLESYTGKVAEILSIFDNGFSPQECKDLIATFTEIAYNKLFSSYSEKDLPVVLDRLAEFIVFRKNSGCEIPIEKILPYLKQESGWQNYVQAWTRLAEDFAVIDEMLEPLIGKDKDTQENIMQGYKKIESELRYRDPDSKNPAEMAIYYSVIAKRSHRFAQIEYNRYVRMISDVQKFLTAHPEFKDAYSMEGYPPFHIAGDTVVHSDKMTEKMDAFAKELTAKYTGQKDALLASPELRQDTGLYQTFLQRVLAYLVIRESKGPTYSIKGSYLTSYCNGEYGNSDQEIMKLIREGKTEELEAKIISFTQTRISDLIEARFIVSFYLFTKETEKRALLQEEMVSAAICFSLNDEMIANSLREGTAQDKFTALETVYDSLQLQHLVVDKAHLDINQIPRQVKKELRDMQRSVFEQFEQETRTETNQFSFIPMKFMEAVFRGYIGMDCSKESHYGSPYIWTVHPDNKYYWIKKNGDDLGYIGLSEAKISGTDNGKILVIDTIQMHTSDKKLVDNIIKQLEEIAVGNGFWGVAIAESLGASFNSDATQTGVEDNFCYKNGARIRASYIHNKATQVLTDNVGKDTYHSLTPGGFIYLLPHKENFEHISDKMKQAIALFIQGLDQKQDLGRFTDLLAGIEPMAATIADETSAKEQLDSVQQIPSQNWEEIKDRIMEIEETCFQYALQQDEDDIAATFEDPDSICLTYTIDGKVVGYLMSGPLEDYADDLINDENVGSENTLYLESIAVLPEYQNKGIALALMDRLKQLASRQGYSFITGHVRAGVSEKIGAQVEGDIYPDWFGSGEDFEYFRIPLVVVKVRSDE